MVVVLMFAMIANATLIDIKTSLTGEVHDSSIFGTEITDRNILSAYSLNELSVYGFIKFNLSPIPDNSIINAMSLSTYHYLNPSSVQSPHNNPTVDILYNSEDSWYRGGTPDLSLIGGPLSIGNTGFPTEDKILYSWTIDIDAHDWSTDLSDNLLTLVLDLAESDYRFVYFYGSGETDSTKHAYDPEGSYAPILHVDYAPNPIPEPTAMLLFGSGLIGLAGFRRKIKKVGQSHIEVR